MSGPVMGVPNFSVVRHETLFVARGSPHAPPMGCRISERDVDDGDIQETHEHGDSGHGQ
jgi:hypothetical protein